MKPLPDILEIQPLAKPPNCTITVPGSKSITNRALILAALADGKCTLQGALWADDTQRMVEALWELGFEVSVEPDPLEECNRTITVVGRGGKIPAKKAELFVGNAGTAARFLTALVCLGHGEYTIRGDERMHERPMKELFDALRSLGAGIPISVNSLPVTISATGLRRDGHVTISTERSSQFLSAIYLISPQAGLGFSGDMDSKTYAYVNMTQDLLSRFADPEMRSQFAVEPDLSSASYFPATQYICGGQIIVAGKPERSLQVDGEFPRFLPPPANPVSRLSDLGDSVMTLAICALFGKNTLVVKDAAHLRVQETDRIKAIVTELRKVGGEKAAQETDDGFIVNPVPLKELHGADIETYNDHRMAMCFSVLGLKVPGIRIKNPSCVSKTFPNFFEKLEQLRQEPSP
jgi:3-phosphoshikimate 1-carboxyvinyltransferase